MEFVLPFVPKINNDRIKIPFKVNTFSTEPKRSIFMSKKKKKIVKMTEEDYNNYVMSMKDEKPLTELDPQFLETQKENSGEI